MSGDQTDTTVLGFGVCISSHALQLLSVRVGFLWVFTLQFNSQTCILHSMKTLNCPRFACLSTCALLLTVFDQSSCPMSARIGSISPAILMWISVRENGCIHVAKTKLLIKLEFDLILCPSSVNANAVKGNKVLP